MGILLCIKKSSRYMAWCTLHHRWLLVSKSEARPMHQSKLGRHRCQRRLFEDRALPQPLRISSIRPTFRAVVGSVGQFQVRPDFVKLNVCFSHLEFDWVMFECFKHALISLIYYPLINIQLTLFECECRIPLR